MARKRKNRVGFENSVVAYLRYSTHNQSDLSIEYQRDKIDRYCRDNGLTIVRYYIDEAKTATSDKREAFQNMITEALDEPPWSRIIVFSFNRFARNTDYAGYYKIQLMQKGITIESATESNENTPEARLSRNVTASYDAYMPECCAVHTHASLQTKARKCEHCGGVPPLGYDIKDKKLVINKYEAETVRLIFDMYKNNYSYGDMVKVLNDEGRRTRNGLPFKKTSFNSILQQEKYIGNFVWNRAVGKDFEDKHNNHKSKPMEEQVRVTGGCEAIIDVATFNKVQERMKNNKRSNASSNGKHHYMFGGMQKIYCAECGELMVGSVYKSHGKSYRYYICPKHKSGECATKNIRALYVENFVISNLIKQTFTKDMISSYNKLVQEVNVATHGVGLKKELSTLNRSIANLMTVLEKSPNDDLIERLDELNRKKIDIQKKINAVTIPPQITAGNFSEVRKTLSHELRHSVDPLIYNLIDKAVNNISVSNDGIEVELNI